MIKILNERDYDYDDFEPSYDDVYTYEVDYFTYYRDSNEFESPVYEYTKEYDGPGDVLQFDMEVEKVKKEINAAVAHGDYPGFWLHRIQLTIKSTETQRDVDYWTGSTWIDDIYVDTEELKLPEDWDETLPDYEYLTDIAYDY